MNKSSNIRRANGIVSALLVVFFLVHGSLGAISAASEWKSPLAILAWAGVALIAVHVVLSILTSREQLTDPKRPASSRKKRHLALKWATGVLLAAAAGGHIAATGLSSEAAQVTGPLLTVVVAAVLAVHICVGAKSLLKDIGIDRRYMDLLRVAVCILCFLFAAATAIGAVL